MESFGSYLKSIREEQGKNLEDISEKTKIAATNLDFLENDRYDLLPPIVFVKGFLKSYAKYLGLDPDDTVRRLDVFLAQNHSPERSEEQPPVTGNEKIYGLAFVQNVWFTRILTAAGILSLVILTMTGVSRIFFDERPKNLRTGGNQAFSTSAQTSRTEKSQPSLTAIQPPHTGKKVLEIKALANAWVRVEPDSGPAEEIMMAPGDIQVFTAKDNFRIITGNAGGIRMRFDGRVMPVLGKSNQTLALTLP
ncbi:MAG: RodZ domain-containing protein [Pseudomonadota bacterium]